MGRWVGPQGESGSLVLSKNRGPTGNKQPELQATLPVHWLPPRNSAKVVPELFLFLKTVEACSFPNLQSIGYLLVVKILILSL